MNRSQAEVYDQQRGEGDWARPEWFGLFGDAVIVPAPGFSSKDCLPAEQAKRAAAAADSKPAPPAERL